MAEEQAVIEEESVEVEIDVPETEPEQAELPLEAEPSKKEDGEELENYSANVQKRISKLTEKYRNEERVSQEATRVAQELMNENKQLKNRMQNLDKGYLSEYGGRVEAQMDAAKRVFKEAHETGDADKMVEAQEAMSKIAIEQERLRIAKERSDKTEVAQEETTTSAPAPQQEKPAAKPDPKAQSWAEKNTWFGADEVMTYAAFGIHQKMVEQEGFDPTSDDYYSEVDRRIRVEFPHKFQTANKTGGAQVASAGASASRSTAKQGRKSVKLSPSQISMAKRLNVPLEEYAKYVKD
jgi:hypothetical protein